VRVTTAYNRMLGLPGAWVRDVAFSEREMIQPVALRRKRPICSGCGARGLKIKDHRVKRWRHLDVGGLRCVIECRLRWLYCPGCGDLPEMVEWARSGARCTRDFDDLTAWLAQQMNQTQVTRLMRIGWETVGNILERVVGDYLDEGRPRRARADRRGRGQPRRRATSSSPASPTTRPAGSCGPPRAATAPDCRRSSTGSPTSRRPRSRPSRSTCPPAMRRRSATRSPMPRSPLTPSMSSRRAARPATRSAATSTTPTAAQTAARASGSRAPATACSKTPPSRRRRNCSSSPRS
jgi:Helix-turn-helix domain of transposase family ISL3/zinc-finger of transposase IS204/IS1001/IS1096/IS1165